MEESDVLLVLLTPGVLTRPYCVLEIVTAFKKMVQIVPVEIQRPGMKFSYPDDEFYHRLRKGELFEKHGIKLLKRSGVTIRDIESSYKQMFMKIALPYSPHKSENVRDAELSDIMKRIPAKFWDGSQQRSERRTASGNFQVAASVDRSGIDSLRTQHFASHGRVSASRKSAPSFQIQNPHNLTSVAPGCVSKTPSLTPSLSSFSSLA